MMNDFIASMYQITRAGRYVTDGVFNTAEEIFDRVRSQRAGVYSVYRQSPEGPEEGPAAEFWGDVAHYGAGRICFDPSPSGN